MRKLSVSAIPYLFVFLLVCPPLPSAACSLFSFSSGGGMVYGRNLDWHDPFPGNLVVNKRGISKSILPWKGWRPVPYDGDAVTWTARYGSVTFTCYGRDFIDGGMNEAGLVVAEASLTAVYPPDDGRPGVSCAQWMQYQLDNFGTVAEVISHIEDLRPDGEGWHYLIADADGGCAVIEYPDGSPEIYTAGKVRVCAATNTSHEQALSHIHMDAAFGGDLDIATGSDSYGRFVRIAALLRDYDPAADGSPVQYAFRVLDEVSSDLTIRSMVYDASRLRVLYKTAGNPQVRWLDFEDLDFSAGTPVRVVDLDLGGPGDVHGLLEDYTVEGNRAIVRAVRGPGSDEAIDLIAEHPTASLAPTSGN
jgi:choloylglycine hydrolase